MACHHERRGDIQEAMYRLRYLLQGLTLTLDSDGLRAAMKAFECSPVPVKSHLIRTKYKLGSMLSGYGENADEGNKLLADARQGKESIIGRSSSTNESIEFYDDLVPYWGW